MNNYLFATSIQINEFISLRIPSVGELYDTEDSYYAALFSVISTPYEMMVQLDDAGIDFTKINDFDLFLIMHRERKEMDTSMLFENIDLRNFVQAQNEQNGEYLLIDPQTGVKIDRVVHGMICQKFREVFNLPRNDKRPGNEEARRYMLERARMKQKRQARKKRESQLENYIVALVNTEQFPYNYSTVRDLTIYQFYASLNQIAHKIKFDNLMIGYYAGTVKEDSLKAKDKTWIKP